MIMSVKKCFYETFILTNSHDIHVKNQLHFATLDIVMINPSVLLFEKTVFPQALDKPCMDFVTCSSLSENMPAFNRHIVTVSGHFFIYKTKMSAFKRHSYNL